MARAAAVSAAEALYRQNPFPNAPGDKTLQIKRCLFYEDLLEADERQQPVDVPPLEGLFASHDPKVTIHPHKTPPTLRRAGVAVVTARQSERAQGANWDLLAPVQAQDEGVDSRLLALRLHEGLLD
jgi:hypothetical protein